jgi:hypothetical protein
VARAAPTPDGGCLPTLRIRGLPVGSSVLLAFLFSLLLGSSRPIVAPASLLAAEKAAASPSRAERLDAAALEPSQQALRSPPSVCCGRRTDPRSVGRTPRVEGSDLTFERQLESGPDSEDGTLPATSQKATESSGLLTLPLGEMPKADTRPIRLVHGSIPPDILSRDGALHRLCCRQPRHARLCRLQD